MIESIDGNNNDFKQEIENCQNALDELDDQRQKHHLPVLPGVRIKSMLEEWDQINERTNYSKEQTKKFVNELALSLREYEISIQEEIKGHHLEMELRLKYKNDQI